METASSSTDNTPDYVESQAFNTFMKSIDKFRARVLPKRSSDVLYKQHEQAIRAAWPHLCSKDYDEKKVKEVLELKDVRNSLLFEQAENTRDHVVRLFAIYEKFLVDLQDEIYGTKTRKKGAYGHWLFRLLTGKADSEVRLPSRRHLLPNPLKNILPELPGVRPEDKVAQYNLDNLELQHEGNPKFSITKDPHTKDCKLEWTDWHCFLYGVRNCEGHGVIQMTLGDGCLPLERRERIRKLLDQMRRVHISKDQKVWAVDMLRLLTDMEYRQWKEQGTQDAEQEDPVGGGPWSEFLLKKCTEEGVYSRTEFEANLSYSVKLWIPRMLKVLSYELIKSLYSTCKEYEEKRLQPARLDE